MIACPVCQHPNDDFAIKCSSCGSFIQNRVPTLDLFSVIWLMIESPKQAFKKIILAEHKNFVLFHSLFLGVASVFALFWFEKIGNRYDNLFPVLMMGSFWGLVVSIPLFFVWAFSLFGIFKLSGGKGTWKETYGVVGWSLVPIVFSVLFVLPLELATIGLYFFSSNPSGFELKPTVFMILVGLDGLAVLWCLVLGAYGLAMAHRRHFIISFLLFIVGTSLVSFIGFTIYSSFTI